MCKKPYVGQGGAYGCGQCTPCRINRRRIWAHRIMLEAKENKDNAFVTLTYNDEHVPKLDDGKLTLSPNDLRNFLKRLRRKFEPQRLRFFAVGEYGHEGERGWNPHYHLAVFNYPCCYRLLTHDIRKQCDCASCKVIADAWSKDGKQFGKVHVGSLGPESAHYIAGYVTKKMTSKEDYRLDGRVPEFARQSNRPYGIGAGFIDDVASVCLRYPGSVGVDVPSTLRHGKVEKPLGRYLQRRLRKLIGRDEKIPQEAFDEISRSVYELRKAAKDAGEVFTSDMVSDEVRIRQREAKVKLYGEGKKL